MTSGMDCVAVTAALSAASGTLDPAPETPSSDKGAREGRVDEVDRNCRIVIDGPKNDTGKDGKSAFPAVAFPARTAVLGVEQLGRSDWSLPCVQFLPVPLPCCSRAAPWLSPPIRRSWPRLRLTCWATRIAAAWQMSASSTPEQRFTT